MYFMIATSCSERHTHNLCQCIPLSWLIYCYIEIRLLWDLALALKLPKAHFFI